MRLRLGVAGAIVFMLACIGGRAFAVWHTTASGSGAAHAATLSPVLATALAEGPLAAGSSTVTARPLAPGSRGDLVLFVDNPNAFPVTITSATAGTAVTDKVGCLPGSVHVDLSLDTSNYPQLLASVVDFRIVRLGTVSLDLDAASECQGATFTIPLTVTVNR